MPSKSAVALVFASLAALLPVPAARGDEIYVTNQYAGSVGAYTTAGATINSALITGLTNSDFPPFVAVSGGDVLASYETGPFPGTNWWIGEYTPSGTVVNSTFIDVGPGGAGGIAVAGGDIFVAEGDNVAEYTTAGELVNASLFTVPLGISDIVVSGGDIFYTSQTSNDESSVIGEYTTSGELVNAALVTGPQDWTNLAVSGGDIFVVDPSGTGGAAVGEYTTSGETVNATLIPAPGASGIAVSGGDIFISGSYFAGNGGGSIEEYTTSGVLVNGALVTGLVGPDGLVVVSTPEPATWILLAIGAAGLSARGTRKRRSQA